MGVSATGRPGIRPDTVRVALVALLVVGLGLFYLYAPPLTPKLVGAAQAECNRIAGDDFRSYRLAWRTTSHDQVAWPHWDCWSARAPEKPPVSLGWWVSPRSSTAAEVTAPAAGGRSAG